MVLTVLYLVSTVSCVASTVLYLAVSALTALHMALTVLHAAGTRHRRKCTLSAAMRARAAALGAGVHLRSLGA